MHFLLKIDVLQVFYCTKIESVSEKNLQREIITRKLKKKMKKYEEV